MRLLLFLALLMIGGASSPAAELSEMYTRAALEKDAKRLEAAVRKIYELGIKPTLTKAERDQLGDVTFHFPMPKPDDDPLNFYAFRSEDGTAVVVMPVLSLKALEDMTTAYAWVQVKGFRHSTIDLYYAMLRHRPPAKFPDGRYIDVLTALGIPETAYQEPGVDKLSLSLRNEAFAFILTHELGHVLFRHKGYNQITKAQARADEAQSDRFALDVLARSATPPLGAVFYFQAQVYRFQHRGEFASAAAWDDYLMTVATHPMTVERIKAMADHISGPLAQSRGREKVVWMGIGLQLGQVAQFLRDPDLQRCIARVAAEAPFEVLKPAKSDPDWAMQQFCGRR
jgi:hypothetical protein